MNGPFSAMLPDGRRLHLNHGPIDLIIEAFGPERDTARAYAAAQVRFQSILDELVGELALLRAQWRKAAVQPRGAVAQRMAKAVAPHAGQVFVTPMAAVAGAVADEILHAMCAAADLERAYVNDGGDIAVHLAQGRALDVAMAGPRRPGRFGQLRIDSSNPVRGIATSGRHGRSLSLGIADSVTALADNAAAADAAATLIANAVDLPDHPAVSRTPARMLDADSDLGDLAVVTGCAPLDATDISRALARGVRAAQAMRAQGLIHAAALFLQDHHSICADPAHAWSPDPAIRKVAVHA